MCNCFGCVPGQHQQSRLLKEDRCTRKESEEPTEWQQRSAEQSRQRAVNQINCFQVIPNLPKYFRSRSESFGFFFTSRETANNFHPAAANERELRQTSTTSTNCRWSNKSNRSRQSAPNKSTIRFSDPVIGISVAACSPPLQLAVNRSHSSTTFAWLIVPESASVDIRIMAALSLIHI